MEVKELMIGDYVNYRGQIIKVTSLYDKGGSNEVGWTDKEDVWVNAASVEPIPLTPEILKKNGFSPETYDDHILVLNEKSGEVIYYGCGQNYGLTIDNQYSQIRELKIQYLHELQHALRLCGIDKEITL